MRINDAGLQLLKDFEGCRLTVYKDIAGFHTVGWGHMDPSLKVGQKISQETADSLLASDLKRFEDGVSECLDVGLTDNQFSALVVFAYNCSLGKFKTSTLLRKVNAGDYDGAVKEFGRWDKAGGKVVAGLTRRRQAEADLFTS